MGKEGEIEQQANGGDGERTTPLPALPFSLLFCSVRSLSFLTLECFFLANSECEYTRSPISFTIRSGIQAREESERLERSQAKEMRRRREREKEKKGENMEMENMIKYVLLANTEDVFFCSLCSPFSSASASAPTDTRILSHPNTSTAGYNLFSSCVCAYMFECVPRRGSGGVCM